jgi:hypothetical protein
LELLFSIYHSYKLGLVGESVWNLIDLKFVPVEVEEKIKKIN